MYEAFYGLTDKPFSMLPDPGFLYLSKQHRTALTLLEYALINDTGFCVVTGEPGAGKTTLLRKLLQTVEEDTTVGMITNTHKSFGELLDWVLSAFNIHEPGLNKVQQNQRFTDFLLEQYANNKTCLLIVDEAQNMKAETLEELRMLSNVNSGSDQLLQIILAGQPALKDTLRQPELMQFAQRIGVDYHLDTLSPEETCHYIQHRLLTAGARADVFTPRACQRIYEYSGGVPRLINLICDTAMVYGFADQQKLIGEDIIEEMVAERMRDSVVPLFREVKDAPGRKLQSAKEELEQGEDLNFPWIHPEGGTAGLKPATAVPTETKPEATSAPAADAPGTNRTPARTARDKAAGESAAKAQTEDAAAQNAQKTAQAKPDKPQTKARRKTDRAAERLGYVVDSPDQEVAARRNPVGWALGTGALLLVLMTVVWIAVENNREIERMQLEAEKQLQREIERKERAAAELAKKLAAEQQQKLERELELKRQAEKLQRERDAALEKARLEAEERARQQKLAEKIRQQKEAEKQRLAREAEQRRQEIAQQLKREQAALQEKLRQQEERLEQLRQQQLRKQQQEAEAARRAAQQAEAARQQQAAEQEQADAAHAEENAQTPGFKADPCRGPTAKFLSICR